MMTVNPLDDWIAEKIGLPLNELTEEVINAYQLHCIRQTISLTKEKSVFYREHLTGINPSEVVSYEQFAKLPFTYPQDVKSNPQRFVCTSQQNIERIVTLRSSGTTGEAKRIFFTKEDQELTIDFFDHGMRNLVGPSDRVLILLPGQTPGSVGDLLRIGLERLGAYPIPYGVVDDPRQAIATAIKNQANSIVGIPVQVLSMARHQDGKAFAGRIKSVLLSTDYVPKSLSRALEELWGCQVYEHYGMTEMGLGGGVQCYARLGYHLREADLFFEIVDPVTGQPVQDGEWGEIVFTTLTRTGMPLIRYRTGDISRFIPGNCVCGTRLRSLEPVKHRISGRVQLENQELSLPELDEVLFAFDGIVDYQVELTQNASQIVLQIDLTTSDGTVINHEEIRQALQAIPAIGEAFPDQLAIRLSENHPKSQGTAKRRIMDLRKFFKRVDLS